MNFSFVTHEKGREGTALGVQEVDKTDHESIFWICSRIIDLHRAMGKPEPPLSVAELFREENRVSWAVSSIGLIFAVFDRPHRASVHIVFWDRRLRGREVLCRGMADYVIHRFRLAYICTTIPAESVATLAFCKRVGFEEAARTPDGQVHLAYTTEVVSP